MIRPEEALRTILAHTPVLSDSSSDADLPAVLRVIAEPIRADRDIPTSDVSRMDGYAVVAPLASGTELQMVDEICAGCLPTRPIARHECSRIYTGGVLPANANAVVKQETVSTASDGQLVTANCSVAPGENVTAQGSVSREGTVVLPAGTPLGAAQAAVCATVGETPRCYRAPQLAVLCTGQEVIPEGDVPGPHQIRDAAGPSVSAAASSIGGEVALRRIVPDDLGQLTEALADALQNADVHVVVTVGGVSVGDYDLIPEALKAVGAQVLLHGVAAKPGKPFLFAVGPTSKPIFGLPGNVLSALVTFFEFVAPAIRKMARMPEPWHPTLPVRLASDVASIQQRTHFVLVRVRQGDDGRWVADPIPAQHSADVVAAGTADGVVGVAPGDEGLTAGAEAQFRPWRPLW